MQFAHDTVASLRAAVDLVNTAAQPDTLTTVAALGAWYAEHGYTGRHDGDDAELAALRALRPVLRELLTADRDRAADSSTRCSPRPTRSRNSCATTGLTGTSTPCPATRPLDRRVVVETAMAMIDVIRADELSRLSLCADEGCGGLVLDLSRNRSRRFCSTTCANRNAVAAYRARSRSKAPRSADSGRNSESHC